MRRPEESVVHGSPAQPSQRPLATPEQLPPVDRLLHTPAVQMLAAEHGHTLIAGQARALLGR